MALHKYSSFPCFATAVVDQWMSGPKGPWGPKDRHAVVNGNVEFHYLPSTLNCAINGRNEKEKLSVQ